MAVSLASRRTVARGPCVAAAAFGSSARAGAASAASARGYFRVPEIKVTLDSVNAAMASGVLKKRPGDKGTRNWLNEQEQRANSHAKRTGVLELGSSCSQDVVTMYQKVCWDRAHLFVSLTKHGDQVVVDANPTGGFGDARDEDEVKRVVALMAETLKRADVAARGITFLNTADECNVKEAERTGREGRNEYKAASQSLQASFSVFVARRSDGVAVARALWSAFAESRGLPHSNQWIVDAAERRSERAAARDARHLRTLRWIERTPEVRILMPKGALDGFRAAEAAGTADEVPAPKGMSSFSRAQLRTKRSMRFRTQKIINSVQPKAAPESTEEHEARA